MSSVGAEVLRVAFTRMYRKRDESRLQQLAVMHSRTCCLEYSDKSIRANDFWKLTGANLAICRVILIKDAKYSRLNVRYEDVAV